MSDKKVDKDYIFLCSDAIDGATLVFGLSGSQIFSCPMSNDLFSGGVMFSPSISIGVSDMPSVVSDLIVIALSMKLKVPNSVS